MFLYTYILLHLVSYLLVNVCLANTEKKKSKNISPYGLDNSTGKLLKYSN